MESLNYLKKMNFIEFLVFSWFSFSGLFNGIVDTFFPRMSLKILVDLFFCSMLFFFRKNKVKQNYILFFCFFICLTIVNLLIFTYENHYGINKIFGNSVLTFTSVLIYFCLFNYYSDFIFDSKLYKLFSFQIFLQIAFFLFFICFNKNNGFLGRANLQIIIFQDWKGRFQGTFSEPNCLGFWIGCTLFIAFILKLWYRYIFLIVASVILFVFCKAKFAMIALPLSLILCVILKKIRLRTNVTFALLFFLIPLSICWQSITEIFYSLIFFVFGSEGSATYATRFSFIFCSLKNSLTHPLGFGFGLNYEAFQDIFSHIVPIAEKNSLDTSELLTYLSNPNNMGSKETLSFLLSSFGFIGVFIYFEKIRKKIVEVKNESRFCIGLILFIFIESLITCNIFSSNAFFCIIFSIMALNSYQRKKQKKITKVLFKYASR